MLSFSFSSSLFLSFYLYSEPSKRCPSITMWMIKLFHIMYDWLSIEHFNVS
jgi:hypothetical protein